MLLCRRLFFSPVRRLPQRVFTTGYHASHVHNHPATLSLRREKAGAPELMSQLDDYSLQRHQDPLAPLPFTPNTFCSLWRLALTRKRHTVLQFLAQDLVDRFHGSEHEQARLVRTVLQDVSLARLPRHDILNLLEKLASLDGLGSLSHRTLETILDSIDTRPHTDDRAILLILFPHVISHLKRIVVPNAAAALSHRPRPFVQTCFKLARRLVQLDEQTTALELFQVLVKTRHVPQQIVSSIDASHKDFGFLIRSALVRAAIHWDWRTLAADVLKDMVSTTEWQHPQVVSGVLECLYGLLESPSGADVSSCSEILRTLDAGGVDLPDGLCRQFYLLAHKWNKGDAAMAFYAFTLRDEVRTDRPTVAIPPGPALTWLLAHMTIQRRKAHLGRRLVRQVAMGQTALAVHDRARFIQLACLGSYSADARILYERYIVGRDRDLVRGDGRVLVRMVSLFSKLIKQAEFKLAQEGAKVQECSVQDPQRELWKDRVEDFKRFIQRVLAEYREVHEPLEQASHFALTSLARCLIMTGEFNEAFDLVKRVLERRELPDVHDINVALTALAEYNPNTAMQLVEHMSLQGIRPDSATFGTVIHHGILHGHAGVVKRAIEMAQRLDERISNKAVVLLIRASVSADLKSGRVKENLVRALRMLKRLKSKDLSSPDLSGKYLVYASLRAHEPELAYKFWDLLVREGSEWTDGEQVYLRGLIGRMTRKHVRLGWMTEETGGLIRHELGVHGNSSMGGRGRVLVR